MADVYVLHDSHKFHLARNETQALCYVSLGPLLQTFVGTDEEFVPLCKSCVRRRKWERDMVDKDIGHKWPKRSFTVEYTKMCEITLESPSYDAIVRAVKEHSDGHHVVIHHNNESYRLSVGPGEHRRGYRLILIREEEEDIIVSVKTRNQFIKEIRRCLSTS